MDLLVSGPERPSGGGGLGRLLRAARRRLRGPGTAAGRSWRRRAVTAVAVLAAAGALLALRARTYPVPPRERPAAAGDGGGPVTVYGRSRLQPPPFDRLPGRTPIPLPSPVGGPYEETVRGALPGTGAGPGEQAARSAARLVLGRYCRFPDAYQIQLAGERRWRAATAVVLRQVYVGPRRLATLRLRWTGGAYAWQGSPAELAGCS